MSSISPCAPCHRRARYCTHTRTWLIRAVLFILAAATGPSAAAQTAPPEPVLLRGFRTIELGLDFDTAEERLSDDAAFAYRGAPDVSLQLSDGQTVIDTDGRGFVTRALLQFDDGILYILTLYLDTSRLDYFTLFEQLRNRYGNPRDLDPQRAWWDDGSTRIELERPLTVRYLDLQRFEARRAGRAATRAAEEVSRDEFLEAF